MTDTAAGDAAAGAGADAAQKRRRRLLRSASRWRRTASAQSRYWRMASERRPVAMWARIRARCASSQAGSRVSQRSAAEPTPAQSPCASHDAVRREKTPAAIRAKRARSPASHVSKSSRPASAPGSTMPAQISAAARRLPGVASCARRSTAKASTHPAGGRAPPIPVRMEQVAPCPLTQAAQFQQALTQGVQRLPVAAVAPQQARQTLAGYGPGRRSARRRPEASAPCGSAIPAPVRPRGRVRSRPAREASVRPYRSEEEGAWHCRS